MTNTFKKAYRHIDIGAVKQVAEHLMLTNLETTTLEVKNVLRKAGFIAFQQDVSRMMDVLSRQSVNWQYTCNGEFRTYTFQFNMGYQLTPDTPRFSFN